MPSNCHDRYEEARVPGHEPVLLHETLNILAPHDGGLYLDCTFGGGGHSKAILNSADCKLQAIDRDPAAAERAKDFAKDFPERFAFLGDTFSKLDELKTTGYAGILMDLGVSSFQLDEGDRGFSFRADGPLDMRMNPDKGMGAAELIAKSSLPELEKILKEYGEEPRFRKLAREMKEWSQQGLLTGTLALANLIEKSLGRNPRSKIHPATLAFQGLRIAVNDELGEIERALPKAFERLEKGGILAVISFHSLEDRIVKQFFKKMAGRPEHRFDKSFVQDRVKLATIMTTKPVVATDEESRRNPRSRSAKLRAIKKD